MNPPPGRERRPRKGRLGARRMAGPYAGRPNYAFWRRSVAGMAPEALDPVVQPKFTIGHTDRVATAGSCFAQHIARTLVANGFNYLVSETGPATAGAVDTGFGLYPARFGNIYTTSQLLQLFERAYGLFTPHESAWRRKDGAWVDPFRPTVQEGGFATAEAVDDDRRVHLAAVREMFETCDVFIFTLGLTESWRSAQDGATFPLPAASAGYTGDQQRFRFENLSVADMAEQLTGFIDKLKALNPQVRVILTVSPVPLIATYEPRHVLVSNTYSKSALRVVAEMACARPYVDYFPSYEIVTGPQAQGKFFGPDMRSVTDAGVAHVMSVFRRHYLDGDDKGRRAPDEALSSSAREAGSDAEMEQLAEVVCDEELIDPA